MPAHAIGMAGAAIYIKFSDLPLIVCRFFSLFDQPTKKDEGNRWYKANKPREAIRCYTAAIEVRAGCAY
jgi:hypothetical protein